MIFPVFRSVHEASEQGDEEWSCEGAGPPRSAISAVLKNGYTFRPGAVSLVALGFLVTKQVQLEKTKAELPLDALQLSVATFKTPVNPDHCTWVINEPRKTV